MVPEEGLEPSIPKERDFESRAYTNSATPAPYIKNYTGYTERLYYN